MFPCEMTVVDQRLATATKRAVKAAGGLKVCEHATGRSDTQISRYCQGSDPASISIRNAVRLDVMVGHPHILNAMADCLGAVVIMLPKPVQSDRCLQMAVLSLSTEVGDIARGISEAVASSGAGGSNVTPREAQEVLEQVADLERVTAGFRHQLEEIVRGLKPRPFEAPA